MIKKTEVVLPGTFNGENHWYPKALNATIHPMVSFFLNLSQDRIINRYCHLHPMVSRDKLVEVLDYKCKFFLWGGADLKAKILNPIITCLTDGRYKIAAANAHDTYIAHLEDFGLRINDPETIWDVNNY